MWCHVAIAMELPGGLGKKREDWLEKQHQEGSMLRKQHRTTQQQELRANAMAGATHRDSRPEVVAKMREVNKNAERGPRPGYRWVFFSLGGVVTYRSVTLPGNDPIRAWTLFFRT